VEVRTHATLALRNGRERASRTFQAIRSDSLIKLEQARHAVPGAMAEIAARSRHVVREARIGAAEHHAKVMERAGQQTSAARDRTGVALGQVADAARRQVADARTRAEVTLREIAGQGPAKTLGRGFAVVRAKNGDTVTGVAAARDAADLQIEFRDGSLPARVNNEEGMTG